MLAQASDVPSLVRQFGIILLFSMLFLTALGLCPLLRPSLNPTANRGITGRSWACWRGGCKPQEIAFQLLVPLLRSCSSFLVQWDRDYGAHLLGVWPVRGRALLPVASSRWQLTAYPWSLPFVFQLPQKSHLPSEFELRGAVSSLMELQPGLDLHPQAREPLSCAPKAATWKQGALNDGSHGTGAGLTCQINAANLQCLKLLPWTCCGADIPGAAVLCSGVCAEALALPAGSACVEG